jgi:hypothetical protein
MITPDTTNLKKAFAIEHIQQGCKGCIDRVSSHHAGVGEVFEDIEIKNMLDCISGGIEELNQTAHEFGESAKNHSEQMSGYLTNANKQFKSAEDLNAKTLIDLSKLPNWAKLVSGIILTILTLGTGYNFVN